jgi:uncharacterized phiE125 gp8 family phage protein
VTVDQLKRHSRIEPSSIDYDLLPLRIQAARQWVEAYTGRALMTQSWSYSVDWVPDGSLPLLLPKMPLIDVTSIKTYDTEDVETIVLSTNYRVDVTTEPGRVLLDTAVGYWAANPRPYGSTVVLYRAGYGTTEESVPAVFRHAVLLLAAELCERLEGATDLKLADVPFGVRALLDPYRTAA